LSIKSTTGDDKGAFVIKVNSEGPACKAGIKLGDTIIKVNGIDVFSSQDVARVIGYNIGVP
jgi:serine protease Do